MVSYSRGDWNAVVGAGAAGLFSAEMPAESVREMWAALSAEPGPGAVIQVLVGSFGSSLGALPSFAVAFADAGAEEVRLMVRGTARVRLTRADGSTEEIGGLGVATWSERTVADVATVELAGAGDEPVLYPLGDGVAAAGRVRWEFQRLTVEAAAGPVPGDVGVEAAGEVVEAAGEPDPDDEVVADPDPIAVIDPVAPVEESEPDPESEIAPPALTHEPDPLEDEPAPAAAPDEAAAPAPDEADDLPAPVEQAPAEAADETLGAVLGQTYVAPLDATFSETSDEVLGDVVRPGDEADDFTTGYDHLLWGETRAQSVEAAAVRPDAEAVAPVMITGIPATSAAVPPVPAPPIPPAVQQGDHDGETVSAEQLLELQRRIAGGDPGSAPPVPMPSFAAPTSTATLVVSSGDRLVLDRGAVVGRRPRAVRATGAIPHLVTVDSPNQDVSRSHVELRVEGSDIVATDLNTTNGTRLLRVGAEPVRLHPGEATLLVSGDRLDLGDDIVLSFEGL
ncbi:FHA domain-containing protein [Microbacterium xylanilyticum]